MSETIADTSELTSVKLKELSDNLYKRLHFDTNDKEREYNMEGDEIHRVWYGKSNTLYGENVAKLYKRKHIEIRKLLNDDDGFNDLFDNLENLKKLKEKKLFEKEQKLQPASPSTRQRIYSMVTGNESEADKETAAYKDKIRLISDEITHITKIIEDIEKLKPIYDLVLDGTTTTGGKRKTRRNKKNKSKKTKSKKNHKKSNRRR